MKKKAETGMKREMLYFEVKVQIRYSGRKLRNRAVQRIKEALSDHRGMAAGLDGSYRYKVSGRPSLEYAEELAPGSVKRKKEKAPLGVVTHRVDWRDTN